MKNILINFLSWLIFKLIRCLGKLPDIVLITTLFIYKSILLLVFKDKEAPLPVNEIKEVITNFPDGSQIIKNIIRESRPSQFISTIKGMLKHHIWGEYHLPFSFILKPKKINTKFKKSKFRIGILGSNPDLNMLEKVYEKRGDCEIIKIDAKDAEKIFKQIDGLEISCGDAANEEFLTSAIHQGIPISLHHSCLSSPEILNIAQKMRTPFRIVYPYLYYPPVQIVKSLIEREELGEVSSIRIQATIGGRGGNFPPEIPPSDNYLTHPAFDHFILLTYLGGPLQKVTAYLNPMDPRSGGQGLIDCSFSYPGRYGLLECTYAPEMFIRSSYYPYALELEIAGTDGIIFARCGMGELIQAPPILIRIGRRSYPLGIETGINTDWESVYHNLTIHFLNMMDGKNYTFLGIQEIISALEARTKSYEGEKLRRVVEI